MLCTASGPTLVFKCSKLETEDAPARTRGWRSPNTPRQLFKHGFTIIHSSMTTSAETSAEAHKTESAVEDRQSAVSNVQSQIDVLTDLSKRLQALRRIPSDLLRSENSSLHVVFTSPTLKDTFQKSTEELRTLHTAALAEKVQEALRVAAESEQRDGTEIEDAREKQSKKRRCVPFLPLDARRGFTLCLCCCTWIAHIECTSYITAALPLLNPRDHICLCNTSLQVPFPLLLRIHHYLRLKSCLHISENSIRHMRRRCCYTFTWHPGPNRAASPYL
jgi:hypothetical protein